MDIQKLITQYYNSVQKRVRYLEEMLDGLPDGALHIKRRKGQVFYHVRTQDRGMITERYIPVSDKTTVSALARKRYIKTVLPSLKKDLRAAKQFLTLHCGREEDSLAESLPQEIRHLIGDLYVSPKEKARRWMEQTWTEAPDFESRPQFKTLRGEYVRSKSEAFIADALFRNGMPYLYERPLYLSGLRYHLFPDFTIYDPRTEAEIYWEHFGMMDDAEYAGRTCRKLSIYLNAGIAPGNGLICTFETMHSPLSSADIEKTVRMLTEE